jgi:multicomponent Na+:H+ antiporter subunit E
MIGFLLNLVLAIVWALLMGSIDLPNLIVGFLLAYAVLWLVQPVLGKTSYFRRVPQAARFLAFFLMELVLSNLVVARDVLSPRPTMFLESPEALCKEVKEGFERRILELMR